MDVVEVLQELAYEHDIDVGNCSVAGKSAIAIKYRSEAYIAIDFDRFETRAEQAVVLAHEIGHIETDSLVMVSEPYCPVSKKEYSAWKWAIRELLPAERLESALQSAQGRLWEVAEELNLTLEFVVRAINYYKTKNENISTDFTFDSQ